MAAMLALVWRSFLVVFVHKVREMVFSSDWRTFEAENAKSGTRMRFIIAIISVLSVSIYIYKFSQFIRPALVDYWAVLLALIALHTVRVVLTKWVEVLFELRGAYEIWFESYTWIHFTIGVLFFPLAVLITYSPEATFSLSAYIGIALFILGETLFVYRLFAVFYKGLASLFYLFLYLCALELMPLLTVFRLLS